MLSLPDHGKAQGTFFSHTSWSSVSGLAPFQGASTGSRMTSGSVFNSHLVIYKIKPQYCLKQEGRATLHNMWEEKIPPKKTLKEQRLPLPAVTHWLSCNINFHFTQIHLAKRMLFSQCTQTAEVFSSSAPNWMDYIQLQGCKAVWFHFTLQVVAIKK